MLEVATRSCNADSSMVHASEGRCAMYNSGLVEYLSFAGSHCNAWLLALGNSCITYESSLMHPSIAESAEKGPIDADRILGRDPALRAAVASGMKWRVIHASLGSVEGFIEWAQSALNTEASQGINELECFRSASPDPFFGIVRHWRVSCFFFYFSESATEYTFVYCTMLFPTLVCACGPVWEITNITRCFVNML